MGRQQAHMGYHNYEMYKNGGEVMIDRMTELFNQVWEEERMPRM